MRNVHSGKYLSAEAKGCRANRDHCREWERWEVEVCNPEIPVQIPLVRLPTTYHCNFAARIRCHRYKILVGARGSSVKYTEKNSVWHFIHNPAKDAYIIRNANMPELMWKANTQNLTRVRNDKHFHEHDSHFSLESSGHHDKYYSFRSHGTGLYVTALCNQLVANRSHKKLWEEFMLEIVGQL